MSNNQLNDISKTYLEAVYGGKKKEAPKDNRLVVTNADKKANTKAYQNYKAGNKAYKAADHLKDNYEFSIHKASIISRGGRLEDAVESWNQKLAYREAMKNVSEKKEVNVKDTYKTVAAIIDYDRSKKGSKDATWDSVHGEKKKAEQERDYAKWERGKMKKDDPNWKSKKYHTGMHGEEKRWQDDDGDGKWYEKSDVDGKISKREKKSKKHNCASKVKHEEFGVGDCISEAHDLDENGNVAHYDVEFKEYIVKGIPVEELEILEGSIHEHVIHEQKKSYETTKRKEVLSALKRDKRPLDKKTKEKIAAKIVKDKGDTSKSDDRYAYEEVSPEIKKLIESGKFSAKEIANIADIQEADIADILAQLEKKRIRQGGDPEESPLPAMRKYHADKKKKKVKEDYWNEFEEGYQRNPEKGEEEERKRSQRVRGERTPRGDKKREEFERWYAANVR